ncbi:Telomerase reverse transcriptase, variant 2 [Entomophthora muscae]|uniref:Telomerase reverse transcriptase, variant 2 n=1 Tax=Entomophthora muscae TaxID=34485 RepID=A0ACC2U8W7_9FUNG|nr:Telomerase reverse transcriptase, variant 2 [Entomophthora muscae]
MRHILLNVQMILLPSIAVKQSLKETNHLADEKTLALLLKFPLQISGPLLSLTPAHALKHVADVDIPEQIARRDFSCLARMLHSNWFPNRVKVSRSPLFHATPKEVCQAPAQALKRTLAPSTPQLLRDVFPEEFSTRSYRLQVGKRLVLENKTSGLKSMNDMPVLVPKSLRLLAPIVKELSKRAKFNIRHEILASHANPESDGSTNPLEVFIIIKHLLRGVLPRKLMGKENTSLFIQSVKRLIYGTRYEEESLHDWMQGLKVTKVVWLSSVNCHPTQHARNAKLLGNLVRWLAEKVVIPLIWSHFHATEVQGKHYKVCYYRQDVWQRMKRSAVVSLEEERLFKRVTQEQAIASIRESSTSNGLMRFVPKSNGLLRPITNFSVRDSSLQKFHFAGQALASIVSANHMLTPCFHVLKFEAQRTPNALEGSLLGVSEISEPLTAYRCHLLAQGKLPKLYFVKVDIERCFERISRSKLFEVVDELLKEKDYTFMYANVLKLMEDGSKGWGLNSSSTVGLTAPANDLSLAHTEKALKQAIIMYLKTKSTKSKHSMLHAIKHHIDKSLVKIDDVFYLQTKGIPQGSILSTLLCSLMYARLQTTLLAEFKNEDTLLLRLTDDFLFISASPLSARRFVRKMHQGFPEYGCYINPTKTLTNFKSLSSNLNVEDSYFPWCGLKIHTKTLSVILDYNTFDLTSRCYEEVANTVTFKSCPNFCVSLQKRLMRFITNKLHPMLITNSKRAGFPRYNLFTAFTDTFMKLLVKLPSNLSLHLLKETILGFIVKTFKVIERKGLSILWRSQPPFSNARIVRQGWKRTTIMSLAYISALLAIKWFNSQRPGDLHRSQITGWIRDQIPRHVRVAELLCKLRLKQDPITIETLLKKV